MDSIFAVVGYPQLYPQRERHPPPHVSRLHRYPIDALAWSLGERALPRHDVKRQRHARPPLLERRRRRTSFSVPKEAVGKNRPIYFGTPSQNNVRTKNRTCGAVSYRSRANEKPPRIFTAFSATRRIIPIATRETGNPLAPSTLSRLATISPIC